MDQKIELLPVGHTFRLVLEHFVHGLQLTEVVAAADGAEGLRAHVRRKIVLRQAGCHVAEIDLLQPAQLLGRLFDLEFAQRQGELEE
ncbi:hypothetical protein D9M68_295980 [compost metagenome]